jgi:hypothetical protein
MIKPTIKLRYGALHNDIIIDGRTFDRNVLTRKSQLFIRNVVLDTLVKTGAVTRRVAA